jgi:hypothetical protein
METIVILPLYIIFCGEHLLCSRLRPFDIDAPAGSGYFLIVGENCQKGFQSDYNLLLPSDSRFVRWADKEFSTLKSWQETLGQDLHIIEARKGDILNAVSLNGTPAQAIDKGTQENAPSYDIAGNKRPLSKAVDIGAFEN